MSSETPQISVIIVTFNTRQMTLECLQTLYAELTELAAEVVVVDNASQDQTTDAIRQVFPQTKLIESPTNVGFAAGNNLGMSRAAGKFFLLLNTDAFVRPGAVKALLDYLAANPKIALAGPRLLNGDGSLQRSCYRFPSPARAWAENLGISAAFGNDRVLGDYRRWEHDLERQVEWVSGACMMLRKEVYERVGGLDEHFFMYAEETDWQRRMRAAGWGIGFTPAAQVTHLGGTSGKTEKAKINRQFFKSLDYYEMKHHGVSGLISLRIAMAVGSILRVIGWSLILLVSARRRTSAKAKVRLQSWLLVRQLTHWRLTA